jgi:GT2 family glycosyltransferase
MSHDHLARLDPADIAWQQDCAGFQPNDSFSVVVVAWRRGPLLIDCLRSLAAQTDRDFETVLVDNGGNDDVLEELRAFPLRYLRTARNTGCAGGRNVGLAAASGEIVFFLDDDAVAEAHLVENCKRAFREKPEVVALRGRVFLKRQAAYNYLQNIRDLGPEPVPMIINQECASAFRRRAFVAAGGWDPAISYGEGLEISLRLAAAHGRDTLLYQPDVIIHHDYAHGLRHFLRANARWARNRDLLRRRYPELDEFTGYYRRWLPKGDVGRRVKGGMVLRWKLSLLRRLQRALWNRPWLQRVVLRVV